VLDGSLYSGQGDVTNDALLIEEMYPTIGDFYDSGTVVIFEVSGFTNYPDATVVTLTLQTYDNNFNIIDTYTGTFTMQASPVPTGPTIPSSSPTTTTVLPITINSITAQAKRFLWFFIIS
jgi:hypothetical protein